MGCMLQKIFIQQTSRKMITETVSLKGDAEMIGLVCNTIRKLFCMSDEGYEVFLMDLEEYKMELEEEEEE